MNTLRGLYRGLEALYGADSGIDPVDFLVPYEAGAGAGQELLLLREDEDGLEIGLCLDDATLARLEARPPHQTLADAALPDALPVIEGLSHLLYVVEAARRERPVSGLELETQAEVDKLALLLLARRPDPARAFARLLDRLFTQFSLLPGLSRELRERYETANRLALAFARTLERHVRRGEWSRLRSTLREFWRADLGDKQRIAAARAAAA